MSSFYFSDRPVIEWAGDVGIYKPQKGNLFIGPAVETLCDVVAEVKQKGGGLVLDFTDVGRIDSSAISVIVGAHTKLDQAFGIFGANQKVKSMLQVTGLHKILNIYETREEALQKTPVRAMRGNSETPVITQVAVAQM